MRVLPFRRREVRTAGRLPLTTVTPRAARKPAVFGRPEGDPDVNDFYVKELWRYPVKSLRGEQLGAEHVAPDGVRGDRLVHVQDRGGLITARTHPGLLGLGATLRDDGVALVEGIPWWDPRADSTVKAAAGPDAELVPDDGPERFDVLPLLVATDGAIEAFGQDRRRLRPNIVIGASTGWPSARGRAACCGSASCSCSCTRCVAGASSRRMTPTRSNRTSECSATSRGAFEAGSHSMLRFSRQDACAWETGSR
jgi:hypothetical protein